MALTIAELLVEGDAWIGAFLVTEAEFWYFDPAVGELKLERAMVEQWLAHDDAKKYFAGSRTFIAVTNYISQA